MRKWLFFPQIRFYIRVQNPITSICTWQVTVSAETNGNIFKWTQVSGLPVEILTPNEKSTTVNLNNQSGPFVLRLTLNDDPTLYEDVTINTLPTETFRTIGFNAVGNLKSGIGVNSYNTDYAPRLTPRAYWVGADNLNTPITVRWDTPVMENQGVVSYTWQENIEGSFQTIQEFTVKDSPRIDIYLNRSYRIITQYRLNGYEFQTAEYRINLTLPQQTKLIFADEVFDSIKAASAGEMATNVPGRALQEVDDEAMSISLNSQGVFKTFEVQVFNENEDSYSGFGLGGVTSTVVRQNVSGIIIG